MSLHSCLQAERGGPPALSRARTGAARRVRAVLEFRRRVELLVVERLNTSATIEGTPLVILIALLAGLIAGRRDHQF